MDWLTETFHYYTFGFFSKTFLEDISPFYGATDINVFELLMTSALGFKVRVDASFACFVVCVHWILQIHLWCNTCWPLGGQHGTQAFSIHVLTDHVAASIGGGSNPRPTERAAGHHYAFLSINDDRGGSVLWLWWSTQLSTRVHLCGQLLQKGCANPCESASYVHLLVIGTIVFTLDYYSENVKHIYKHYLQAFNFKNAAYIVNFL